MSDTLYADLVLLYMGRAVTYKGDVEGHPFHGNQYGEGQGGGSGEGESSGSGSGESAISSAQDIQSKTHTFDDVKQGRVKVGVEGSGGNDIKRAEESGMFVTKIRGIPIYARNAKDAEPLIKYLKSGGRYGSTKMSKLLGYTKQEINQYADFLRSQGRSDLIEK